MGIATVALASASVFLSAALMGAPLWRLAISFVLGLLVYSLVAGFRPAKPKNPEASAPRKLVCGDSFRSML